MPTFDPADVANDGDLDDILNSALDDFDTEDDHYVAAKLKDLEPDSEMTRVAEEAKQLWETSKQNEIDGLQENMNKFLEDAQNPEFQKALEQAFRELNSEEAGGENIKKLLGSLSLSPENEAKLQGDSDIDVGVAKTMQSMAEAATQMEGMESAKAEQMGEEMMNDMMKQFEKMGEKKDFQQVVDSMMEQLLAKEVLYDPMKQICQKYPEWLADNESLLSKADYERYGKQYQFFQEIVGAYETEPDNIARIMELMQDMQECGQPPSEIVKELAPGLHFDEEGMPIMPNMGPGAMPGLGGFPAGAQLPGQEQCCLM